MKEKGKKGPRKIKQVWRKKPPPPPPWVELPRDLTANILQRLSAVDILENAQKVCTTWHSVCIDPFFWRVIDMRYLHNDYSPEDLDVMCRYAVELSQGQLIDIKIENFGSDDLLEYIAERCSQLRRLRIACCDDISGAALSRFPLLEELHIFFTLVFTNSLEMVGRSCPLLKSFSLNDHWSTCSDDDYMEVYDEEALTIAKSMPGLLHLRLFGNSLTNNGLQAILDGCPHLESLDLRQCYGLELSGDLGKRCSQQIKSLKLPYDSDEDCEFLYMIQDPKYCGYSDIDLESDYYDDDAADYLDDYDDYTRWDHEDYWDNEDFDFWDIIGF